MKSRMSSTLGQIQPPTAEFAALERLKKTYNGKNDVSTFS